MLTTEHQELLEFVPVSKNNIGSISVPSPILAKQDQAILATPSASIMASDIEKQLAEVARTREALSLVSLERENQLEQQRQKLQDLDKRRRYLETQAEARKENIISLEGQLNEAGKNREKLLSESLARDRVAEQIKQKLSLQSERSKELDQIVESLTSARIKAEEEFNEREEELLSRSLAAANEKYEKRREETARLLAACREELVLSQATREAAAAGSRQLFAILEDLNKSGGQLALEINMLDLAGQLLADRFDKLRGSGISLQESSDALHTAGIKLSEQVDVLKDSGIALAEVIKKSELSREKQEVIPQHQIKLEPSEYISPLVEFAPSSFYLTQNEPSKLGVTPDVTDETTHQVFTEHQELLEFVPTFKVTPPSLTIESSSTPVKVSEKTTIEPDSKIFVGTSNNSNISDTNLPRNIYQEIENKPGTGISRHILTAINLEISKRHDIINSTWLLNKGTSTSHKESQMGVNAGDNGDTYLVAKGVWISGLYGYTVNNRSSNSYKSNLAGTTLGFDILPTGHTLIGIAYSTINALFRYTNAKSNVNAQGFAFYSQHLLLNNYIIEGLISIARSKVNSIANKKTSEDLYKQATAKFKSTSFSGELSVGYSITTSLGLTLIPNIGIKYANHKDGSYKENGDSGMNLEVHPIKAEQRLTTVVGFKAISPKVINSNTSITHYSNFSIENYFSNKPKVKAKLTWMDNYFEGKYGEDKVNKVGFNAGYGLVIKYKYIELSTNYHYHVENKLQNHQGSVKFKALF